MMAQTKKTSTKVKPTSRVTPRALLQRINRKLSKEGVAIRKARPFWDGTRGPYYHTDTGEYYRLNTNRNSIMQPDVDIEALGRELGALAKWEALGDS